MRTTIVMRHGSVHLTRDLSPRESNRRSLPRRKTTVPPGAVVSPPPPAGIGGGALATLTVACPISV